MIALLMAAAVPVNFHASTLPTQDDCVAPESFFGAQEIAGAKMKPTLDRKQNFDGADGILSIDGEAPLRVRTFRIYDAWRLYASPINYGFDTMSYLVPEKNRTLDAEGELLPIHWSSYPTSVRNLVHVEAFMYVQGGVPTVHPLRSGLSLAFDQLLYGTRPLTVLMVSGERSPRDLESIERAMDRWFLDAWRQLEASCHS